MTLHTYDEKFMVQRAPDSDKVRALYGRLARVYDLFTDFEPAHHRQAVALAAIQPHETVLEVACGTGRATAQIAREVGRDGRFYALDLTPAMLQRATSRLAKDGLLERVDLRQGDAADLPYPDASVDVIYNGYMFDLIDADRMPLVLAEFARVLKPGGRVVLVNMSKDKDGQTLYEWLYERGLLGFASGACRPVQMAPLLEQAGFKHIERIYRRNRSFFFLNWLTGTEIVVARKAR
jgi:ubiquinone/menaquinone biosynthesis C-methylase UbiE